MKKFEVTSSSILLWYRPPNRLNWVQAYLEPINYRSLQSGIGQPYG